MHDVIYLKLSKGHANWLKWYTYYSNKKKQKQKMHKKKRKKPTHTHTVGTAPQTKRKIVERCKIPLTLIHDCLYHGGNWRTRRKPPASHWQTLSHNVVLLHWSRFELTTSVVIGTDFIGSCISNYHTITATTPLPQIVGENQRKIMII